jgi:hypothetical protein
MKMKIYASIPISQNLYFLAEDGKLRRNSIIVHCERDLSSYEMSALPSMNSIV